MNKHIYDTIIIGGGPAGYTAALYNARSCLDTVLIEKLSAGGQIALTDMVENYPGFDEGIDGFSLGMKMKAGAEKFGAKSISATVTDIKLNSKIKEVSTENETYFAKTVFIATGASHKFLGIDNEDSFLGKGIHYCASCDGMFYRGKTVVVVGGGNSAVTDALLLSRICEKVILIHRRDTLRASKVYDKAIKEAKNIEIIWNSTVTSLFGDVRLNSIEITNTKTAEKTTIPCDGVFVSIGRKPETDLFKNILPLDEAGYIVADETTKTNLDGVFAIGDVRTKPFRQVVTATADGAVASHMAESYLAENF